MPKYRTIFRPEARAELRKLQRSDAVMILRKLTELETDPYAFATTPLVGNPSLRRLRIGNYRVVYTLDNGALIIWVVHVDHRSTVYDD